MDRYPALADFLVDHMPPSVGVGFHQLEGMEGKPMRRAERAALYASALLTLLACAGTVVPLYLLARVALPAPAAWAAAALWPLAPAANLFQPVADTIYPFLSTSAWALVGWAARSQRGISRPSARGVLLALVAGIVMALGLVCSLAFLPVGLIAALIIVLDRALSLPMRTTLILVIGFGFSSVLLGGWLATGANPFVIGVWNLHNHARFYVEYPRTYTRWLWVNPVELAIAVGLPTVVWFLVGLASPRTVPPTVWATLLVLTLVNLTGRNMGEVARLWMLFTPPLLIAAGVGCTRVGGGPVTLGISIALLGAQTLVLQSFIQVVYPV
jgi:hypothetical protein